MKTPHKGGKGLRGEKTQVGKLEAQELRLCLPQSLSHCEQAGNWYIRNWMDDDGGRASRTCL